MKCFNGIFVAILLASAVLFSTAADASPYRYTPEESPSDVPFFTWFDGKDAYRSLRMHRGDVVLLNLWATWCAPCVLEMPDLNALQARYEKAGLVILPIAIGQEVAELKPFYAQHQLDALGIYYDPFKRVHKTLQARVVPTTYLIDRKGKLVGTFEGPAPWGQRKVRSLIENVLKQGGDTPPAALPQRGIVDAKLP